MKTYLKGIVCFAVAVVGGAIAQGLIVGAAAAWCTIVIGALATAGVVAAKNASPPNGNGRLEYLYRADPAATSASASTVMLNDSGQKAIVTDEYIEDHKPSAPKPAKKAAAKKVAAAKKARKR